MGAAAPAKTPRVLHIVESLDRTAIEGWLLEMLAHARRTDAEVDWTFYCSLERPGSKENLARSLGATVVRSPVPIGQKAAFARALRAELRRGRYEVLHAHHDLTSGFYLAAAAGLPIRRRLVHVHNVGGVMLTPDPVKQALLRPVLRGLCLTLADRIVGNSQVTLDAFLAGRRRKPGRDRVHYLGVDTAPYEAPIDRAALRGELGLDAAAPVLLFAGRMTPEKNPLHAVEVLAALRALRPDVVGVFAGTGSLEEPARRRAAELGLAEAVRFLGWRDDLPAVMQACDVFILPACEDPMEGFGLAALEAQLAGLRLLISRGVPDDPLLPTAVYRRLPLAAPAPDWAKAAVDMLEGPAPSRAGTLAAHGASPMQMDRALADLMSLHA